MAKSPRIYTITQQKGGVGKSTVVTNVAAGMARRGEPTLIIDCDPQGDIAHKVGCELDGGMNALLVNRLDRPSMVAAIQEFVKEVRPNLFVLPGDKSTADAFPALRGKNIDDVRRRVECVFFGKDYRHIFLDTSPSIGGMQEFATYAADYVIVPVTPEDGAIQGLSKVTADLKAMGEIPSDALRWRGKLLGILMNEYREGVQTSQDTYAILKEHFSDLLMGPIHEAEVFKQAEGAGKTIWEYEARNRSAKQAQKRAIKEYNLIIDTILHAK